MGLKGFNQNSGKPLIRKTVAGRAVHTVHTRAPIVPQAGTSLGANYQPTVPADARVNPLARMPLNY